MTDLGLRETRLIGCDGDVGGELVQKTPAHRPAVYRRNDRLPQPPHMRPVLHPPSVGALPELDIIGKRFAARIGMPGAGRRLALVIAGAERAAGAGEDDHAHGTIGVRLVEDAVQLGFELVRERVHPLGPIERDRGDALLDAVNDFFAHATSSLSGGPRDWSRSQDTLVRCVVKMFCPWKYR